jgi:Ca2+-binding EF-hand superfamily protein
MIKYGLKAAAVATALMLALPIGASKASEADEAFNARYAAMDLNGDGIVSVKEFGTAAEKFLEAQRANGFARVDRNGDGLIEASELYHPARLITETPPVSVSNAAYTSDQTATRDFSKLRPVITVEEIITTSQK